MSAIVANATLFPACTASTASAVVRSLLPVSQADEFRLGTRQNAIAMELECEVEPASLFDGGQARHSQRGADTATVAQGQLLDKCFERLNPGDLTLFQFRSVVSSILSAPGILSATRPFLTLSITAGCAWMVMAGLPIGGGVCDTSVNPATALACDRRPHRRGFRICLVAT